MTKADQKKGRDWVRVFLLVLELTFILTTLVGAWFVYWPAALLLTGIFGILATERIGAQREVRVRPAPRERVS